MASDYSQLLQQMFRAAINAASPALCIPPHLPSPPLGRTLVIGAGKASAAMAQALESHWPGELSGLVVTRYGHAVPCRNIEVVEAAHPVPDSVGMAAAQRMLAMVRGLTQDDMVICLFSGGGSALLPLPLDGLALEEKQQITQALLKSGAGIREINCVRRHLSAIKGGKLAAACFPAQIETLLISDVPGDDPVDIASGPTVADPTTCADALKILERYGIKLSREARTLLTSGTAETIKPDDRLLARARSRIVARPMMALDAAAQVAQQSGFTPLILGDDIEGEARDVASHMAQLAMSSLPSGTALPYVLLSGGETTVTVRGDGRGGRNVEFLLALALALNGCKHVHAIAGDTDGIDGMEEIAGAIITPDTLAKAAALGLEASAYLARNNAHDFFAALGDSVHTGPTLTNVNDFRAILIVRNA